MKSTRKSVITVSLKKYAIALVGIKLSGKQGRNSRQFSGRNMSIYANRRALTIEILNMNCRTCIMTVRRS